MQRALVERARNEDADAFTQLVMASAPRLARVAETAGHLRRVARLRPLIVVKG